MRIALSELRFRCSQYPQIGLMKDKDSVITGLGQSFLNFILHHPIHFEGSQCLQKQNFIHPFSGAYILKIWNVFTLT